MFKIKFFLSIIIFSLLLITTSIIKNQTRELEKKTYQLSKIIFLKEKDLNESQLDFSYLTSPSIIESKIEHLDNAVYSPIDYSKIFLELSSFMNLKNKFAVQEYKNEKKIQKK